MSAKPFTKTEFANKMKNILRDQHIEAFKGMLLLASDEELKDHVALLCSGHGPRFEIPVWKRHVVHTLRETIDKTGAVAMRDEDANKFVRDNLELYTRCLTTIVAIYHHRLFEKTEFENIRILALTFATYRSLMRMTEEGVGLANTYHRELLEILEAARQ